MGSFEQNPDMKLRNGTLVRVPRYEKRKCLYYLGMPERIRWAPDPGSPLFGEIDRGGSTVGIFGKYNNPLFLLGDLITSYIFVFLV